MSFTARAQKRHQQTIGKEVISKAKETATTYKLKVRDKWHQVCREFYTKTLKISESRMECFHKRRAQHTGIPVLRRPQPFSRKSYSDVIVAGVKALIESFPKVESHYCRANTEKQYLEPDLTIAKMYILYYAHQVEIDEPAAAEWKYYDSYNTLYNLA